MKGERSVQCGIRPKEGGTQASAKEAGNKPILSVAPPLRCLPTWDDILNSNNSDILKVCHDMYCSYESFSWFMKRPSFPIEHVE